MLLFTHFRFHNRLKVKANVSDEVCQISLSLLWKIYLHKMDEEQEDEIQALKSIYDADFAGL